jgi:hypothetical protein
MEVRGSKTKRTDQAGRSGPPQRERTGYTQGHQTQQRHHATQSQPQSRANPGGVEDRATGDLDHHRSQHTELR